jgi:glucokinase-like ROK family protein
MEQFDGLDQVLGLIRTGHATTRPQLAQRSGLGRTAVAQRVSELIEAGVVIDDSLGPSTGGRAPRQLRFNESAGRILAAEFGATTVTVCTADLAGHIIAERQAPNDIASGPDDGLGLVETLFDEMLADERDAPQVWGVGISLPGPVEFARGRPISPPIMPGWDDYGVRERLTGRYGVPAWVDNDVNVMALGELRAGHARGARDFVCVKIGTGIGAGLVSGGLLHRGAQGCAGDVGHVAVVDDGNVVCRCGNTGCLEALAGGAALARDGQLLAATGRSAYLSEIVHSGRAVSASDVSAAARHGDPGAVELLNRSGRLVGNMLATVVNFYNPSLILIGGSVTSAGDLLLAAMREAVYRRSLPLATRDLRIAYTALGERAGLVGATCMVIDELFSRESLPVWLRSGSPVGHLHQSDSATAQWAMTQPSTLANLLRQPVSAGADHRH